MSRFLTILEVSKKQAYIFSSNELSACMNRSDQIAAITSAKYLENIAGGSFSAEENLVYAGGGHTVLEFPEKDKAENFCRKVTTHVPKILPDIELFTTTIKYDDALSHSDNQKALIRKLEKKKALRKASFHQGTFGVEKLDVNTKKPITAAAPAEEKYADEMLDARLIPQGFRLVKEFGKLGQSKDESSYIAVVHIDGNGMGSRVSEYYTGINSGSWEEFKEKESGFSNAIDEDYKKAYAGMLELVAERIRDKTLDDLSLKPGLMPVRRIISSGDDMCFVTEGRIGLECAAEFIRCLCGIENQYDKKSYTACAGVAIVHQKYPFYRAYKIAEALCKRAKEYGASITSEEDNGRSVSAIDWHLGQGELADTVAEIRASYINGDGKSLIARPLIIEAPEKVLSEHPEKKYQALRKSVGELTDPDSDFPRGKIKGLREALKKGEGAARNYVKFNRIDNIVDRMERGMEFDAVEIMDTFISLEKKG